MSERYSFFDDEHERAFEIGRARVKRGAPAAPICGARTRQGGLCKNIPIREGKGRCLRHAGPHAARAHRERQLKGLETGRVSPEEWCRSEARRAANRLSRAWRKNPWLPGTTIDLQEHEDRLQADLIARGVPYDLRSLAPAVADWLRWRFRRFQIDRTDVARWERVLSHDLPLRVRSAGAPPDSHQVETQDPVVAPAKGYLWTPGDNAATASSKRQQPDRAKAPLKTRGKGYRRPGRPRTQTADVDEMADLMAVYRDCRETVAPMLERCRTSGDQVALLRALRDVVRHPADCAAQNRWVETVGRFSPR